jgi:hypothetical protein
VGGEKHPPQVACDGNGYLFMVIRSGNSSKIYKLGSGENGTIPGKIYQEANCDYQILSWVFFDGKLYARTEQDWENGYLIVIDPVSL